MSERPLDRTSCMAEFGTFGTYSADPAMLNKHLKADVEARPIRTYLAAPDVQCRAHASMRGRRRKMRSKRARKAAARRGHPPRRPGRLLAQYRPRVPAQGRRGFLSRTSHLSQPAVSSAAAGTGVHLVCVIFKSWKLKLWRCVARTCFSPIEFDARELALSPTNSPCNGEPDPGYPQANFIR